ncbi:hypothetical protein VFMJ11_B0134 (plasmid) [Aliivibrio fischeri MJ11]|uniref:Uncharacterized protein n=1 Tax=Aliivibrio fischeri (strain MJ11) TaxID=388396 RepID=B5EW77_ALIFM|nr:hypothetical protein [Aliivibrio fischeri]ACH64734.1 hypothetical protein VFMJ11_B0134 [Aliivibrio fischeri MJ11]
MKRQNKQDNAVVEVKFNDVISKIPTSNQRKIRIGNFHFNMPKFWMDDRKCAFVAKVLRNITIFFVALSLALATASLIINDKKREWNLHTYNQDGEVKWIEKLNKVH